MNLMSARWMVRTPTLVMLVGLMFPGAAAEPQLDLHCNVTRQPDGSTLYRVSEPRGSNRCTREWMGQNNTVFARDSDTLAARVLNVTDTSITLRGCEDFLHFTWDCREGFEETFCRVNCSGRLDESLPRTEKYNRPPSEFKSHNLLISVKSDKPESPAV
ncbi:uncharacterized protein AB9X84_017292 isoform 2-T2 [Acanthopagrus schlegelii]